MTADAYFEPASILQGTKTRRHHAAAHDDAIDWKTYDRVAPGEYSAYCTWAKWYFDPGLHRWTCLLRWDVYSRADWTPIATDVPLWFNLGDKDKPRASRRGKYLREWVRAYGRPPEPKNRLSPKVFTHRIARVEIGDAISPAPYSVVKKIIEWETGSTGHSVSKSTNQVRPVETSPHSGDCER